MIKKDISKFDKNYKIKRSCFNELKNFVSSDIEILEDEDFCKFSKIMILWGLKSGGKSTLLEQIINEYKNSLKCAYYELEDGDNMGKLFSALLDESKNGTKLVCIDNITKADDFIYTSSVLASFATDMKIIIAGDESLSFTFAGEEKYLQNKFFDIHTSYISFREHKELFERDFDDYVKFGGLMNKEIVDAKSARKYADIAISRNIMNSVKNDYYGSYELDFKQKELDNIVYEMLGLLAKGLNEEFVCENITKLLKAQIKPSEVLDIINFLYSVRAVSSISKISIYDSFKGEKILEKSEYSLQNSSLRYFILGEKYVKNHFKDIFRQTIILDIKKSLFKDIFNNDYCVYALEVFDNGDIAEFYDLLVWQKSTNKYFAFKIELNNEKSKFFKRTYEIIGYRQCEFSKADKFNKILEGKFGKKALSAVLYKGQNSIYYETAHFNIDDFLIILNKYKDIQKTYEYLLSLSN